MQKISRFCTKFIELSFYALFFITPFIFNSANSELFEMPKMYFIYALTTIIVGAWLIKSALHGKLIFQLTVLDIPFLLFLVSQIASTYFSIDQHTSVFGYYSRINGGLLSLIAYCLLYWAYVSNMDRQKTLYAIRYLLISATIVAIWGIFEHFGYSPSCPILKGEFNADCWVQDVQTRVFATLGQPNWMAAWLIAIFPLSFTLFKNSNNTLLHRGVYFGAPGILLAAILFTKSRSGLLGLGAAAATYVFFLLPNKLFLKLGYITLVLLSGLILWNYNLADCFDLNPNQLSTTLGTESCKIRTIVWKGALDIWRNNPVVGTGPETFAYSYYNYRPIEHNLTSEWELLYNKAHNEYLNLLANTGAIGLLTYLLLIISTFRIFNFQISNLQAALFAGYVSILVTNFFGFSISVVNLLFFLYPAMALVARRETKNEISFVKLNIKRAGLLVLVLLVTCYVLLITYRFYSADLQYAKADRLGRQNLYQEALGKIKSALFLRDNEPLYYNKLAEYSSNMAINISETGDKDTADQLSKLAIDSQEVALSISPFNLNFLKNQSIVYARLSFLDPNYLKQALPPLEKAVQLAPTDPKVHYNLGVLYERNGEIEKALEMINKALFLKPDYSDAIQALRDLQPK